MGSANPVTVNCVATFANPKQFPLGIECVSVNGKMVLEKAKRTGAIPGEPLIKERYVER